MKHWCLTCLSANQNSHLQLKVHSLTLHVIRFPHFSLKMFDVNKGCTDPLKICDPCRTQSLFTVFIFIALLVLFMNAEVHLGFSEISTELYFLSHLHRCVGSLLFDTGTFQVRQGLLNTTGQPTHTRPPRGTLRLRYSVCWSRRTNW